jgi:hypothetical protein
MKLNILVLSVASLFIQSALTAPATPDLSPSGLEKDHDNLPIVSDMIQEGWPEEQADAVVSLFDAVDALTDLPPRDEEDSDEIRFFDNLRVDVSQLLAQVGYGYKSVGARQRVISRLADETTPPPHARKETMIHVLHELVSLVRSANVFVGLLDNPTLSEYSDMLLNAAQLIERLVTFRDTH